MKEKLLKYTCEGARIHIVFLNDAVRQMQKAHALSEEDASRLGQAAAIAQCLTADRKEDNASVAVTRERSMSRSQRSTGAFAVCAKMPKDRYPEKLSWK